MAVAEVLVHIPFIGLSLVVALAPGGLGGLYDCTLFEPEGNIVFKPDGVAGVNSGRE